MKTLAIELRKEKRTGVIPVLLAVRPPKISCNRPPSTV